MINNWTVKKNKNKLQPVAQQSVRLRLTLIVTGFIFIFGIIFFLYSNLGAPKSSKGNTKKINLDQLWKKMKAKKKKWKKFKLLNKCNFHTKINP